MRGIKGMRPNGSHLAVPLHFPPAITESTALSTLVGEVETAGRAQKNTHRPYFTAPGVYFSLRRENQEGLEFLA